MVSPELLRRYPVFSQLNEDHLISIAMITEEINVPAGDILFEEGQPADYLYLLETGSVDLTFKSEEKFRPETKKVFPVGEINPGELFGISAVLEPYIYTASEHTSQESKALKIDATGVRAMMKDDPGAGYIFMSQVAKAIMERLTYTRIQLAAAWA